MKTVLIGGPQAGRSVEVKPDLHYISTPNFLEGFRVDVYTRRILENGEVIYAEESMSTEDAKAVHLCLIS